MTVIREVAKFLKAKDKSVSKRPSIIKLSFPFSLGNDATGKESGTKEQKRSYISKLSGKLFVFLPAVSYWRVKGLSAQRSLVYCQLFRLTYAAAFASPCSPSSTGLGMQITVCCVPACCPGRRSGLCWYVKYAFASSLFQGICVSLRPN